MGRIPIAVGGGVAVGVGNGFNPPCGVQFAADRMVGLVVGFDPAVDRVVVKTQRVIIGVGDLSQITGCVVLVLGGIASGIQKLIQPDPFTPRRNTLLTPYKLHLTALIIRM